MCYKNENSAYVNMTPGGYELHAADLQNTLQKYTQQFESSKLSALPLLQSLFIAFIVLYQLTLFITSKY